MKKAKLVASAVVLMATSAFAGNPYEQGCYMSNKDYTSGIADPIVMAGQTVHVTLSADYANAKEFCRQESNRYLTGWKPVVLGHAWKAD